MNRRLRILASALLTALVLPVLVLTTSASAGAVPAVAHGQGVMWLADHTSWLGNWELGDGNFGLCLEVTRPSPAGADFEYTNGFAAGWYPVDDAARLTFLSRHWGSPGDPLTAAAAQLATWTITGLAGHDQAFYAQRANADAALVLQAANHMLHLADGAGGASRGARATVDLRLDGAGGSVVSDLVIDYLAGSSSPPPTSHFGTMTLQGAVFADGSRTKSVANGIDQPIVPDAHGAVEDVAVEMHYDNLPYGPDFRLGHNRGASQDLLVTSPFPIEAWAWDRASAPNELPFQPRVQTVTSTAVAEPGAELTDALSLDVHPGSATGSEWAVYRGAGGALAPVPVMIESTLWGPLPAPPGESAAPPAGAPQQCVVETAVRTGPGRYRTPGCVIAEPGYYVWTDSIDPARTPPEQGGDRLQGWESRFGVAVETTLVPASVAISTTASTDELTAAGCVSDHLAVSGFPAGAAPISVTSTLVGPVPVEVEVEPETTPKRWEDFPVAGTVKTDVGADGVHESPCVPVLMEGFYYFIYETAGSVPLPVESATVPVERAAVPGAPQLIPAQRDTRVHRSESVRLAFPTPPPGTPTPSPGPSSTPTPGPTASTTPSPTAPGALAQTGSATVAAPLVIGLAAVGAGVAGCAVALRRRR